MRGAKEDRNLNSSHLASMYAHPKPDVVLHHQHAFEGGGHERYRRMHGRTQLEPNKPAFSGMLLAIHLFWIANDLA